MAYEKKTWVCGETITADGLNNIENGIEEALDCCESKLPAVTTDDNGDILTVVDGEWEKAEPEYKCSETRSTAYTESVTTGAVSGKDYSSSGSLYFNIYNNKIAVTFEGTEYILSEDAEGDTSYGYGEFNHSTTDPIFTTYPCAISYASSGGYLLLTPSAGTYSIKVEDIATVVETSDCFGHAVKWFGLKNVADKPNNSVVVNNIIANEASGNYSYAEGSNTKATSDYAHAEGATTTASGSRSHAEGDATVASGQASHAEGSNTKAEGMYTHAEGYRSTASGSDSHAEGNQTIANHRSQHAFGEFNVEDPSTAAATAKGTYIEIVGCGTSNTNRSNARTLDWNGNEVLKGSLTLGSTTLTEAQLIRLLALI